MALVGVAGVLGIVVGAVVVAAWVVGPRGNPPPLETPPPIAMPDPLTPTDVAAADTVSARFPAADELGLPAWLGTPDAPETLAAIPTPERHGFETSETTGPTPAPEWPDPEPPPETRPADPVLSDGQIAALKARLTLTAEQEPLWQPVEDALKRLAWGRIGHRLRQRSTIEPAGLAALEAAAKPFVDALRPDQKREIRAIAHVMGLGKLASDL
ncbi:hypothetical protein A33M_3673 [Rhodovulum sp. PH10]|uniref:hypothetical protein n=1 Tax=Rhodovulum sp. PH10 TaxID=1187851 RepID=UPI00027C2E24|nr:hypothetical protein [Rhodovulum sp. PH10]EJW10932.1 hypothetical protein A33M_3673 [Rhodovulum sp. PH10]